MQVKLKEFFRTFGFLYILLFVLLAMSHLLPLLHLQFAVWDFLTETFAHLIGQQLPDPVRPNSSGDTKRDCYQIIIMAMVSILGGAIWTALGTKTQVSQKTDFVVRYFLAAMLLTYGAIKLVKGQFPYPSIHSIQQPAGDMSPMGLLWFFMGYSRMYCLFAGLMEIIPGLLLLSVRATPLAAILSFGVTINIFMLNMSYDVPVKILSAHFVILSAYLIWRNRQPVMTLVGLNLTGSYRSVDMTLTKKRAVKWALGLAMVVVFLCYPAADAYKRIGSPDPKVFESPLFRRGLHLVNERPYFR